MTLGCNPKQKSNIFLLVCSNICQFHSTLFVLGGSKCSIMAIERYEDLFSSSNWTFSALNALLYTMIANKGQSISRPELNIKIRSLWEMLWAEYRGYMLNSFLVLSEKEKVSSTR